MLSPYKVDVKRQLYKAGYAGLNRAPLAGADPAAFSLKKRAHSAISGELRSSLGSLAKKVFRSLHCHTSFLHLQ